MSTQNLPPKTRQVRGLTYFAPHPWSGVEATGLAEVIDSDRLKQGHKARGVAFANVQTRASFVVFGGGCERGFRGFVVC